MSIDKMVSANRSRGSATAWTERSRREFFPLPDSFIEPDFWHAMESEARRDRFLSDYPDYPGYPDENARSNFAEDASQAQRLGHGVFEAATALYAMVILGVIVEGYLFGVVLRWW